MALFEFSLTPLEKVSGWGPLASSSKLSLSWFGLTQGCYSIDLPGTRIFQLSRMYLESAPDQETDQGAHADCIEYYVVRLWEDLLQLLPEVLLEVPDWAYDLISTPEAQVRWLESLSWVLDADDDELYELYSQATHWFGFRKLDTGYFIEGPRVWLFNHRGAIHLSWDNSGPVEASVQRWSASSGVFSLPIDGFLNEVDSFDRRLMSAMAERVSLVRSDNLFPCMEIDLDGLLIEHEKRTKELARAKNTRPQNVDWKAAFDANKQLQDMA